MTSNAHPIRHYRLGRLPFSTRGNGRLREMVESELTAHVCEAESEPAPLVFDFMPPPPAPAEALINLPVSSWPSGYAVRQSDLHYRVSSQPNSLTVQVETDCPPSTGVRASLQRFRDWNYLTREATAAKNFFYDTFTYLTQVQQLRVARQSYIHASSFAKDDRCVAVLAWGGVGKTTSMLKMVLENGWLYLGDDLPMLDADGVVWRSPLRLQVYAYNTLGEPLLHHALLAGRGPFDRLSWELRLRLRGPRKVRRRILAEELFGAEKVAHSARLTHAIFAERANVAEFSLFPAERGEVAERAASTLMRELDPYHTIFRALEAAGHGGHLPAIQEVHRETRNVIYAGLRETRLYRWRIPLHASPAAVYSDLKSMMECLP